MMNITKRTNLVAAVSSRGVASAVLVGLLVFLFVSAPPASAQTFTVLYQFRSGPGGINPYAGVVMDAKGDLFGTTYNDGAFAAGTVFRVNSSGKEKVLHSFGSGTDGFSPEAGLIKVKGTLYGTTYEGGTLKRGTVFTLTP